MMIDDDCSQEEEEEEEGGEVREVMRSGAQDAERRMGGGKGRSGTSVVECVVTRIYSQTSSMFFCPSGFCLFFWSDRRPIQSQKSQKKWINWGASSLYISVFRSCTRPVLTWDRL